MHIVVLITAKDKAEAEKIAQGLISQKLAACCNIVASINSVYWWQGKVEDSPEALIIVKTQQKLFKELVQKVKELHSYTVPEIIALPIVEGSEDYLRWIDESCQ